MTWKKGVSGAAPRAETGLIAAVGWMFPVGIAGRINVTASQTETGVPGPGGLAARGGCGAESNQAEQHDEPPR